MDWAIAGSNVFMAIAATALIAAPLVGHHGGWRRLPRFAIAAIAAVLLFSFSLLVYSWRDLAGGVAAASFGHVALIVSVAAMAEIGRMVTTPFSDRLAGALAAFGDGVILVIGVFAEGPLADGLSKRASVWLLTANPLVAITSAAGIDFLHLDTIYRTSPLAHRGVVLPAWTTACAVYAVAGIAAHGASRLRPRSHSL